jgi:hypothetical protein
MLSFFNDRINLPGSAGWSHGSQGCRENATGLRIMGQFVPTIGNVYTLSQLQAVD